ncbi:MAG: flagellar basal-body rod protein FlgF [Treponema sp.]|nr:flagellar basal-body rod protein FlgF [Treponema sp.]
MVRAWYTGASGMRAQQFRLDTVANNLANVDVNGYKKDTSIHKSFPELLMRRMQDDGMYQHPFGSGDAAPIIGKLGLGVEYNETYTQFEQGPLKQTDANVDMALDGQGFFAIGTPYGERYTRNGAFQIGKEGILETKEGYPVLGENGILHIDDNDFTVDKEGRVWITPMQDETADATLLDSLKLVEFGNERYLQKQGSSFYRDTDVSGPAMIIAQGERPRVEQGFIEGSNVNPVLEMVQMIEVNRAYEANQKVIQTTDAMAGRLINEVTRLA